MKNPAVGWTVVIVLLIVIGILSWLLITMPAGGSGVTATSTATTTQSTTSNSSTSTTATTQRPIVTAPKSGATVPKTFTVTGQAPGTWYFEASFPVQVVDPSGNVVGQIPAQALSDWMTSEMVPFKADITVNGYTGPATLVLKKDNPSGLPEHDDSISLPIVVQ